MQKKCEDLTGYFPKFLRGSTQDKRNINHTGEKNTAIAEKAQHKHYCSQIQQTSVAWQTLAYITREKLKTMNVTNIRTFSCKP